MGFVRVWWPSVVVGLVVAFLGIGVAEVAGMPAGSAPGAERASVEPVSRPASVAPAAIERVDDVAPASPASPTALVTSPPVRASMPVRPSPSPKPRTRPRRVPAPRISPIAVATPRPKPTPAPVPSPSATPAPLPRVTPIVHPKRAPVRPAQALDLRRWKLTLPAGRQGRPTEYRQPALGSLANGSFIRLTPDGGVAFRAPVGGVTTGNSSYPRSELREMSADGRREASWTNATGRHVMTMSQAITATPRAKPHVVAGQIHDSEDDVVMIRLEGRRLFVESDGDDVGLLDPHYRLGRRFTVSVVATSSGVRVRYNQKRVVHVRKIGHGWYFKAGCYPQSNPERGDHARAFGEVVIYALTVRHSSA